jgi:predicted permease
MSWKRQFTKLHSMFARRPPSEDLKDEIRAHLRMEELQNLECGMSPEEAHYAALRRFGNVTLTEERSREMWSWHSLEIFVQDVRYALRQLRRSPGFAAVVVLSLALGIGLNTAIFTVIDAVLLRTLPVKSPAELVLLSDSPGSGGNSGDPLVGRWPTVSYDAYRYFVDHNQSFQGIAAFRRGRDPMEVRWPAARDRQPERAEGQLVSGNYFEVMGVGSALGRVFGAADDVPNARAVAVISHNYWEDRLHRDPAAVGRAVDVNGTPFTIVGIAPPEFFGEHMDEPPPDFWLPLDFQPEIMRRESFLTQENEYWLNFVARLKPGVTGLQAQAVLNVQLRQFLESQAGPKPSPRVQQAIKQAYIQLAPGRYGISHLRDFYSAPLHTLMGFVMLVLLVACANVANLLLSRSAVREKEISMRLIAGATRARLIRQMLTESLLLAVFGGAAGLLLANWGVHLLGALLSRDLVLDVANNPTVLAFTLTVAVLTGFAFGLVPALRVSRMDLSQSAKGAATGGRLPSGLMRGLIVIQIAVSMTLLAGAGLLVRSLVNLETQNLGFNRENVLLVQTDPRLAGIKVDDLDGLYRQILDHINTLPGVRSATIAYYSPMSGHYSTVGLSIEGYTPRPGENMITNLNQVAPNYFETLGIPILAGRPIGPEDTATVPKVAVVNQAFAARFFLGQNPVGRYAWIGHGSQSPPEEIVGLVGDARYLDPGKSPEPFAYVPLSQNPGFFAGDVEVRTTGDPSAAAAKVRQAIRDVDSALPITSVQTLPQRVNATFDQPRLIGRLSMLFSVLALILAALGLYGVMAHWVARRTQEIGVRMALGARRIDVLRLVVGRGLMVALMGTGFGLMAALGLTRVIASSLYRVKPADPITFGLVPLVVVAVTLLASYIPARRAAKVDPMVALRYE